MSGKALIDNSAYSISSGKTRINDTNYTVSQRKTLTDGTTHTIDFIKKFTVTAGSGKPDADTYLNIYGAHYTAVVLFGAYTNFSVKDGDIIYIGVYSGKYVYRTVIVNKTSTTITNGQFVEIPVTSNLNILFQDTTWIVT